MKFDMNRAWGDAIAMISANRELMLVVAGVFFLLPSLALSVFFADAQMQAMADLQKMMSGQMPADAETGPSAAFVIAGIVGALVQLVGFMALLAVMDDSKRPTVGEALNTAIRCLPTLIGAVLLFILGYIVVAFIFGLVIGGIAAVAGDTAILAIPVILLLVAITYVMTKLSLTLAVIVLEGQMNPVKALTRSWQLTSGNSLRLFAFYLLLGIAYMVISLLISGVLLGSLTLLTGGGTVSMVLLGLISGAIGAAMNMLLTAIIAAIHRQLAGPSMGNLSTTFE